VAWRRRRRAPAGAAAGAAEPEGLPTWPAVPATARAPLRTALVTAAVAAVVLGLGFGLRAGAVGAPLIALVLWRGVSDRALALLATGLLAGAVPLVYVLVALLGEPDPGGYGTNFAVDRIIAHWLALAALTALTVVLVRTLAVRPRGEP
jgi:hypothetical protein